MRSLERYQRDLVRHLYAPAAGVPAPSLVADGVTVERARLGVTVHRNNLIFGICRAMAETYPLCRALVGGPNFDFLCKQYLHRFPSRVCDLGDYGERFAEHLAERPEVAAHPFLTDVARLEWLMGRAERLPREAWLAPGDDALERPAGVVLLLCARYTILDLWRDHARGGGAAIRGETVRRRDQYLIVWSDAGRPRAAEIDAGAYARLGAGAAA